MHVLCVEVLGGELEAHRVAAEGSRIWHTLIAAGTLRADNRLVQEVVRVLAAERFGVSGVVGFISVLGIGDLAPGSIEVRLALAVELIGIEVGYLSGRVTARGGWPSFTMSLSAGPAPFFTSRLTCEATFSLPSRNGAPSAPSALEAVPNTNARITERPIRKTVALPTHITLLAMLLTISLRSFPQVGGERSGPPSRVTSYGRSVVVERGAAYHSNE